MRLELTQLELKIATNTKYELISISSNSSVTPLLLLVLLLSPGLFPIIFSVPYPCVKDETIELWEDFLSKSNKGFACQEKFVSINTTETVSAKTTVGIFFAGS